MRFGSPGSKGPNNDSFALCRPRCMCVCVFLCMYACVYACVYACICMYVCMFVYGCISYQDYKIHINLVIAKYSITSVALSMCVCIYICMGVCVCLNWGNIFWSRVNPGFLILQTLKPEIRFPLEVPLSRFSVFRCRPRCVWTRPTHPIFTCINPVFQFFSIIIPVFRYKRLKMLA